MAEENKKQGNAKPKRGNRQSKPRSNNRNRRKQIVSLKSVFFTKLAIEHASKARALSAKLKETYGENTSISALTGCLSEILQGKVDKSLIEIPGEILDLYSAYDVVHQKRELEKQSFRSNFSVSNVSSNFEDIRKILEPKKEVQDIK